MDTRRREPRSGTDFAREAEILIRSLAGVVHAHVLPTDHGDPGIDAIHVVAADPRAAEQMTGYVRSALLAGMATPVVPARIHVRTAPGDHPNHYAAGNGEETHSSVMDPAPSMESAPTQPPAPTHRDRLRLIHATGGHTNGHAATPATPPTGRTPARDTAAHGLSSPSAHATAPGPHHAKARLVAVDVQKAGDGRLRCRVSIAWNAHVHRADAIAMDLPGAAAQAAAQAAVRALTGAGVHGLELNGLREVEIAGRDYVLVALRRSDSGSIRIRSGSALMMGSPERSAAEATVDAANDLL